MKKIYMILAAMSLLTLSLYAQVDIQTKAKPISKTQLASYNFNKMVRGIKGMESILSVSGQANGQFRAPLRYDADLFNTLGPFTGDNFDYGIGFPEAYPEDYQDILVTTVLNRSEYESHIGDEIVGFRFALWGDATKTVKVSDFITYPFNSNSGFDQNHLYEWTLTDLEGNQPPSGDDPTETTYQYVKITDAGDLTSGQYLIVCETQNVVFNGSLGNSGTPNLTTTNNQASVTISSNTIESNETTDGMSFTYDATATSLRSASGFYIGRQSGTSGGSLVALTDPYAHNITFSNGVVSIKCTSTNGNNTYYMRYNSSSNCFRYYTSSSQTAVQLYKKVAVTRSMAPRRANRGISLLTGWSYASDDTNFPSTWTMPSGGGSGSLAGSRYFGGSSGADIVIPASDLHGVTNVTVKVTAGKENTNTHTLTVNGTATSTALTTSLLEYTWDNVDATSGVTIHVSDWYVDISKIEVYGEFDDNTGYAILEPGQWHEFYLDHPVEFQVENDDDQLFMGYWYKQYPLASQNDEVMNPAAVNSQSTGHTHYVNMIAGSAGAGDLVISLPYSMNVRTITVYDTNGNTLTTWDASTAYNNSDYTSVTLDGSTYAAYNLPTGWSISDGNYFLSWNSSTIGRLGYLLGDDDLTIASSALNGNTTVRVVMYVYDDNGSGTISVNGQSQTISGNALANYTWNNVDLSATVYNRSWFNPDFSEVGDLAVQLIFKSEILPPVLITPEDGSTVNVGINEGSGVSTTITVSGENLTQDLTVSVTGDGFSVSPTTISAADANAGTATVTITYTGTDPNATGTLTISSGEVSSTVNLTASYDSSTGRTPMPQIDYVISSDGEYVTITATGDGTVTLNVPGYDPVSGQGEASITIPCGAASNTITVTATAQEDGLEVSNPATRQITIPAGSDWVEMDGTYDNPNDLLSFLKNNEDIMMVDQFAASTLKNEHPDHYTYTLRQTVNGETTTSTPVSIPVYKTNSSMQGLYTKNQVDVVDKNMSLRPNVVNTEMDFDVNPDRNVLYYSLYRGDLNATYPEITAQSRVSQLQKFEEMVGEGENAQPQYFLFESHQTGIAPRYDRLGTGIAERLDTNWVEAGYDDQLAYVPVIWTYGLYTARGDGKNNSYGSDIKREYMGKVDATITGTYTAGNDYGTWKVGETEYCVFHPTITVTGVLPQNDNNNVVLYNDEDEATYVPYMCRAWCTYEGIHDFIRNSDGNLQDAGALPTPYWLGDAIFDGSNTATIGGEWTGGATRDQWSFGLPSGTNPDEVTYIIRFYYKKVVTEGQQNGSQGKFIGGAAEEYFMAETGGEFGEWVVGINELSNGIVPVSVTYVNPQGMQSSRPFDGVNIVVTRYSDGSTRTSKIVR